MRKAELELLIVFDLYWAYKYPIMTSPFRKLTAKKHTRRAFSKGTTRLIGFDSERDWSRRPVSSDTNRTCALTKIGHRFTPRFLFCSWFFFFFFKKNKKKVKHLFHVMVAGHAATLRTSDRICEANTRDEAQMHGFVDVSPTDGTCIGTILDHATWGRAPSSENEDCTNTPGITAGGTHPSLKAPLHPP